MKTLGIEMIDAGFEVAVGRLAPGGGMASAERLTSPGTVPAVVALDEGEFHFGTGAEERRFLFPRQVNDVFWEEFSLAPSTLRRGGRTLSFSEVSFHFLRHLVNGLPGVASEHESLALAVPSPFIEGANARRNASAFSSVSVAIWNCVWRRLSTPRAFRCSILTRPGYRVVPCCTSILGSIRRC